MAPLHWGIVTVGKISHDFVNALTSLPEGLHTVVAAAARNNIDDAKKFAEEHDIPKYCSYEDLAKDKTIDVVYIGAINAKHYELSKLYLDHGKHVLCEKHLCVNFKQCDALLKKAKTKNLFLLEGIWSRFFPSYIFLREQIGSGALGEIKKVDVQFGFENLAESEKVRYGPDAKNLGGGTILDLGVYAIQVALWAFDDAPTSIEATAKIGPTGVDYGFKATLKFPNDGIANLQTSAEVGLSNIAVIEGTKGTIELHNFWCPTKIVKNGKAREWPLPTARWEFVLLNSCGFRYEAEEVRLCIQGGKLESASVSHEESRRIAKIQDAIREQIGVKMPEDEMKF